MRKLLLILPLLLLSSCTSKVEYNEKGHRVVYVEYKGKKDFVEHFDKDCKMIDTKKKLQAVDFVGLETSETPKNVSLIYCGYCVSQSELIKERESIEKNKAKSEWD